MAPDTLEFEIDPEKLKSLRVRSFLIAFSALAFISLADQFFGNGAGTSSNAGFYINLVIAVLAGLIIQWGIKRRFDGFKIMIDDTTIVKTNKRRLIARLQLLEITHMVKKDNGYIFLYSKNQGTFFVPNYMSGIDNLEDMLKEKAPVFIASPYSFYQKNAVKLVYILAALFLCMLALKNKIAVAIIGGFLLLGIVFVFSRSYQKLKSYGITVGKDFFVGPLVMTLLVLISLIQKLLEQ